MNSFLLILHISLSEKKQRGEKKGWRDQIHFPLPVWKWIFAVHSIAQVPLISNQGNSIRRITSIELLENDFLKICGASLIAQILA